MPELSIQSPQIALSLCQRKPVASVAPVDFRRRALHLISSQGCLIIGEKDLIAELEAHRLRRKMGLIHRLQRTFEFFLHLDPAIREPYDPYCFKRSWRA